MRATAAGPAAVVPVAEAMEREIDQRLAQLAERRCAPGDPLFAEIERLFFTLAPRTAACPERIQAYLARLATLRREVKRQSETWDMGYRQTRVTLYRLLYGGRMAAEEAILQAPPEHQPAALLAGTDEASATPWSMLLGVKLHSGDILVSRGGAPTSALIARGNDFQGNFSHIALVHVEERTNVMRIVEAHIEQGVAVATPERYLQDKKLRVMVLRLRADLPAMQADPMLPHRAAAHALQRAKTGHIPYDFAMDHRSPDKMFCSEVASDAYRAVGMELWAGHTHLSTPGVRRWLGSFGVRHFETQEPADLEYDPQVRVVAEWRDPETLRKDHVDNAVTDALLEAAERGAPLDYSWWLLPVARGLKAYSWVLNQCGGVGPVPEGMSATAALRNKHYAALHAATVTRTQDAARRFQAHKGYPPPYWQLVQAARDALREEGFRY